jgi:glycerophosphoryl diester phosphodiesterase
MSFSHTALQRMERLAPSVRLVQLIDKASYWPLLRRVIGADWLVGPGIALLKEHPRLAERIVGSGHDVHVWTVNSEANLRLCQELGVQAVITDRPAYLLDLLDRDEATG